MAGPYLPDIELLQACGLPLNKKMRNAIGNKGPALNDSILRSIRVMDEQDAIERYEWFGLPAEIEVDMIERILYYRQSAMFFYLKSNGKFYFLPYVGSNIDIYGRYITAQALPFNGSANTDSAEEKPFVEGKTWDIQYSIVNPAELTEDMLYNSCVLLNDYSKNIPNKSTPRAILQEPLLQVMSECVPLGRTALINSAGVMGYRVNSEDESPSVYAASNAVLNAALNGDRWVPITAPIESQELSANGSSGVQDYLMYYQSLNNLRLEMHGVANGGVFEKRAHILGAEQAMNAGQTAAVLQNGLRLRQQFCNIINSIWGLGIWCEISETASQIDKNGDGEIISDNDPDENGGEDNAVTE